MVTQDKDGIYTDNNSLRALPVRHSEVSKFYLVFGIWITFEYIGSNNRLLLEFRIIGTIMKATLLSHT